jgi:nucleoside-diphosphate-sugar epimerase
MDLRGKTIAVTGATGFLGRYVVDALLARGARVVGVVRNPGRVPELAARGVVLRRADLLERERLAEGFAGADALVSNAALFSLGNRSWEEHQRTNLQGTENVLAAAAAAGVRRVVHVSSVAVYAGLWLTDVTEDHEQLTERTRRTLTNAYAVSKAVSEQLAWRLAAAHRLELTTVRPCAIYGAFDPNFTSVFKRLTSLPVSVMPVYTRMQFVYGGDVAEAIALALEHPESAGRAYNTAGDDATAWEFSRAWQEAGGRTPRLTIPLLVPIARTFSSERARRELGWQNRPLVEGLRDTFAREAAGSRSAA